MAGPSTYKLTSWKAHDGWYWRIETFQGVPVIMAPNPFTEKHAAQAAGRRAVHTIRGARIEEPSTKGPRKFDKRKFI